MNYVCRAECRIDATRLEHVLTRARIEVRGWDVTKINPGLPDVIIAFSSSEPLEVLRHAMAAVKDGHVMRETLAEAEDFTGERTYVRAPKRD